MPIYEYICKKCGQEIEILQKISDQPLKKCTMCGGSLSKRVSQSAFHLKGSGWYKDGYSIPAPAKKGEGEKKKVEPKAKKEEKPNKNKKAEQD